MTALVTVRRFPRGLGAMPLRRKRGVGDSSLNPWVVGFEEGSPGLSTLINYATGQLSQAQLAELEAQNNSAIEQAATNPTTGQINQSLAQSEELQSSYEMPAAANVSNVSTGSYLANVADSLTGNYTQPVGYPGTTPALGSASANPVQTFGQFVGTLFGQSPDGTWSFPWGTAALVAALALGGYLIYENVI